MRNEVVSWCSKKGSIRATWWDDASTVSELWVRFSTASQAKQACRSLDGARVKGRKIRADFGRNSMWAPSAPGKLPLDDATGPSLTAEGTDETQNGSSSGGGPTAAGLPKRRRGTAGCARHTPAKKAKQELY